MGDEVHVLMATDAGRSIVEALLRDGRKHGVAALLATHNERDLADERIKAAIAMRFLFRTDDRTEISASNRGAGLEDTEANARERMSLVNGECIALLDNGSRGRFRWDRWQEGLEAAANTTPSGRPQEVTA